MPDGGSLVLFVAAAVALVVVPGPAVLYIVAQSIQGGRAAGLASAAGVATGGLVHVLAAVVGLSALLAASAEAFSVVKLAGAAYLVYLGLTTLLRRGAGRREGLALERDLARSYRRGALVNVLNPKTAVFFLAFLPQFVDPQSPARPQLAVLGAIFLVVALASDAMWALAAGAAAEVLRRSRSFLRAQRLVSGSIYLGLGVATAIAGPHRSG